MASACLALLALSFVVMIGAARVVDSGQKAQLRRGYVGCSFLLTVGEIYLFRPLWACRS